MKLSASVARNMSGLNIAPAEASLANRTGNGAQPTDGVAFDPAFARCVPFRQRVLPQGAM